MKGSFFFTRFILFFLLLFAVIALHLFHVFGQSSECVQRQRVMFVGGYHVQLCYLFLFPTQQSRHPQREVCARTCVCVRYSLLAFSVSLSLWPTGGRLMPLSAADTLPPHFFPLPCRPRSLLSSFSLVLYFFFFCLFLCTYRRSTFVSVSHSGSRAARGAISVEIKGAGLQIEAVGFKVAAVISMLNSQGIFFLILIIILKQPLKGKYASHHLHVCCSATTLRPGKTASLLSWIFPGFWLTHKQLRWMNIFTLWVLVSFTEMD